MHHRPVLGVGALLRSKSVTDVTLGFAPECKFKPNLFVSAGEDLKTWVVPGKLLERKCSETEIGFILFAAQSRQNDGSSSQVLSGFFDMHGVGQSLA